MIIVTFVILGFASPEGFYSGWNELWHSGLPIPFSAWIIHASAIYKSIGGGHLKLGLPTPHPVNKRSPATPLSSAKNFTSVSQPANSKLAFQDYLQHLADSLQAEISVAFRDLETGQEIFFHERRMMHAASTMKVPVMIEVFRQAEKGKFGLDDSVTIKNQFASIVDGSPYRLDISDDSDSSLYRALAQKMSIRQLVEQMITVSSNLATNLLIELVGAEKVTATLRELGMKNMQVRRGVEDIKAYQRGWNNQTDAFDMMLALQVIAEKRAASPTACDSMLAILQRQKFRDGIPAGLPDGTVVGNKTGSITKIAHDGAIVFPKVEFGKKPTTARKPYVLVVLTKGIQEEKSANNMIAEISRKIYLGLMTSL